MESAIFCMTTSEFQAENTIDDLKIAGFTDETISALLPARVELHKSALNPTAGNTTSRTMGWLSGLASIPVPGAGPFYAAGPVLEALRGGPDSPNKISGALEGMGLPREVARKFEKAVLKGGILLSIHSETSEQIKAMDVFQNAGAQQISRTSEIGVMEQETKN